MRKLLIYKLLAQFNSPKPNICAVDQVRPCLVRFCWCMGTVSDDHRFSCSESIHLVGRIRQ